MIGGGRDNRNRGLGTISGSIDHGENDPNQWFVAQEMRHEGAGNACHRKQKRGGERI